MLQMGYLVSWLLLPRGLPVCQPLGISVQGSLLHQGLCKHAKKKKKNRLGQFGSWVALPQRLREAGAETSQLFLSCGVTEVCESLFSECESSFSEFSSKVGWSPHSGYWCNTPPFLATLPRLPSLVISSFSHKGWFCFCCVFAPSQGQKLPCLHSLPCFWQPEARQPCGFALFSPLHLNLSFPGLTVQWAEQMSILLGNGFSGYSGSVFFVLCVKKQSFYSSVNPSR